MAGDLQARPSSNLVPGPAVTLQLQHRCYSSVLQLTPGRRRLNTDLTCTLLVTCAVEHVGYVVGGHGLGLELSAGQSDGDVLQGA